MNPPAMILGGSQAVLAASAILHGLGASVALVSAAAVAWVACFAACMPAAILWSTWVR